MRPARGWTLVVNDLHDWVRRPGARWGLLLAAGVAALTAKGRARRGMGLFRAVLGGPSVRVSGGQLYEGPDWTWLALMLLFAAVTWAFLETEPGWIELTWVRGASRTRWAVAQLAALAVGALAYLAELVFVLEVVVWIGGRPGPLFGGATLWDVGCWALGLVSVAWAAQALCLVTGGVWPSLALTCLLLSAADFGGVLAPYTPYGQWIVALHHLPGTLSVSHGVIYVALWAILSGLVVWARVHRREFHA